MENFLIYGIWIEYSEVFCPSSSRIVPKLNATLFPPPPAAAAAAKSLQSCSTLCDSIDSSPPGSAAPGIPQARTLEWVAISFSNAGKWKAKVKLLSHVQLYTNAWTAAYQAPTMGFSRQEYWSGVPLPSLLFLLTVLINWTWMAQTVPK